jgi:hypothetical protein
VSARKTPVQEVLIPIELTAADRERLASELALTLEDLEHHKRDMKEAMTNLRVREKELWGMVQQYTTELRSGRAERVVTAQVEKADGMIRYWKPGKKELLYERPMTPEEAQEELDLEGGR